MIGSFDGLSNLTNDDEELIAQQIADYFDEMEIDDEGKKKRTSLAIDIEKAIRNVFILMIASEIIGDLDSKADYFSNYAYQGYTQAMIDNDFPVDETGFGYIEQYSRMRCKEIVDTAILHKADTFYGTTQHTIAIGEDESSAVNNYFDEQKAISQGMKHKTWITMRDKNVRHSHTLLDGQTIGIFQAFHTQGGDLLFPCDVSLGVKRNEIINCRCFLQYSR